MPETPELSLMIIILWCSLSRQKRGRDSGKWSVGGFVVVSLIFLFTFVLSFGYMDLTNLLPLFGHNPLTIARDAFNPLLSLCR
jgi:hypothetical protein